MRAAHSSPHCEPGRLLRADGHVRGKAHAHARPSRALLRSLLWWSGVLCRLCPLRARFACACACLHVCVLIPGAKERLLDALLLRDIAMRAKKYLVVRPSAAYIVGTQIYRGSGPSTLCWVVPNSFLNISYPV